MRFLRWLPIVAAVACSSPSPPTDAQSDGSADASPSPPSQAVFDLTADLHAPEHFYDVPYPSDLRLTAQGTPDVAGFRRPAAAATLLDGLIETAQQRRGFPTLSVGYFRFTAPVASQDPATVIPAERTARVLLVDVDPRSDERGRLVPTVAATPRSDGYLLPNSLAVAARPGFVLRAGRTYAFVVMRALGDALGRPLESAPAWSDLAAGRTPDGPRGAAVATLYRPLVETLGTLGVDVTQVATATVFTTGDVVADTAALGDRVLARHDVTVDGLALAAGDDATSHPRFCQLTGTVTYPQFQHGVPPFDADGNFRFDADGNPTPTTYPTLPNYARAPVSLTLPRAAMPAAGYPLVVYFHGSGGTSRAAVDRGTWAPESATHPCPGDHDVWNGVTGCNTLGQGPAHVLAPRGFATAASALPVNPERLPMASETAYLNLNNLRAFRDTFRQGVLEQRLFIRALSRLSIPASLVAQCTGAVLPAGVTAARFDVARLVVQGQSMGGMYTNLISATEPAIRAAIPTGAGGYWGYFILQTQLVPGAASTLGLVLNTNVPLTFMHPALALLETAWEPADPIVYMPRVAREPLPNHPTRPIYEPVGQGDSYFPTTVYDAVALAYGHQQAGATVWPTMQTVLALDGLSGTVGYPVADNRRSRAGTAYTGVVVQYAGDGVYDPHALYSQLDAVKYQYSCFAQTFVATGTGRVFDPTGRAADAPCAP
jgi:hypothetical protein